MTCRVMFCTPFPCSNDVGENVILGDGERVALRRRDCEGVLADVDWPGITVSGGRVEELGWLCSCAMFIRFVLDVWAVVVVKASSVEEIDCGD